MKTLLMFAAAAALAAPAMAQTTPNNDQSDMSTTDTEASAAQADQAYGYQPDKPALSATPQPGQEVIFKQAPPPNVAYPPPPAKASYPLCKKGQTDGCRQRGG